ncbi:arylsulfatase [Fulvivirgaceae bacterium BMA10]|uniref:Arylsulfatase n=1 Tax=Splendidivirga corallicola TaxID=3051826 RepID=A0ABT8KU50_9BACT|nr:arylsulfatase [Fulvivirgaceae bacterium BMA10]
MNKIIIRYCLISFLFFIPMKGKAQSTTSKKPNIIFILSDDLGYGDIGFFGQKKILTPSLDKMAKEGMVFTQHYAGGPVCSPSRACLMTGLHQGHGYIKGNPGGMPEREQLRDEDTTVAELLQNAGYETACIGKWGLGQPGTSGYPLNKGFNYFVGYDTHVAAHNYYPESLHRNNGKLKLKDGEYSHDVFTREAMNFLNKKHDKPFFLYLAYTIPHGPFNPPDITPYEAKDWPDKFKKYAAMITRMDRDIGKILQLLATNGLGKNTLVIFTSDNGPQSSYGQGSNSMTKFFDSNGPLRGIKRDVLEGGIRIPYIAWWPEKIKAGTSDVPTAFQDFLPTACDLGGIKPPGNIDGISMVPLLFGNNDKFKGHEMMYWEFIRMGGKTKGSRQGALDVRNNIKAVRYGTKGEIELYFLNDDLSEKNNVAKQYPGISKQMKAYMDSVRTPSKLWPIPEEGWVVSEDKE